MSTTLKIIVADDHEIFRNGLSMVINRMEGAEVIAEAANGKELLTLLNQHRPDIILTDIMMPEMNGIEATQKILELRPEMKVIAISMNGEEAYLQQMLEAGACGFVLKNIAKKDLAYGLRQVHSGQQYFSPELLPFFTQKFISKKSATDDVHFTKREIEILQLVATGMTNQQIGDTLYISKRTVDGHKANLIAKTGSKNVVNLLVYAIKHKLVEI